MSRFTALGMIVAIMALVMAMFSFAPIASADPADSTGTTTTTPTTTTKAPSDSDDDGQGDGGSTPPTSESPAPVDPTPTAPTKPTTPENTPTTPAESETDEPADDEAEEPAVESTDVKTSKPNMQPRAPMAAPTGEINQGIVVEITDISVEKGKNPPQVTVNDEVRVEGTWDATNATPQFGDKFTITFPAELKLNETLKFDLVGGEDDEVYGSCTVDQATNLMECTLSEAVEGKEDVKGDFYVYAKAVKYTEEKDLEFLINGSVPAEGELPGGGGIDDGQTIGEAKKTGELQPDKQAVRWKIDIPGSELMKLDPEGTGKVELTDTLSENMKLCAEPRLNATLKSGRPNDQKPVTDGVKITQTKAGEPVTIAITNGEAFDAKKLYTIEYTSCTTSGTVDLGGVEYTNTVDINGVEVGEGSGIEHDWKPDADPKKSGSWVGDSRYSEIVWTIMIPGEDIKAKGYKIDIMETLGAGHQVCTDGLAMKIEKSNYLPDAAGNGPGKNDASGDFTKISTDPAAGTTTTPFKIVYEVKDQKTFNPEQYYYVEFRTCLTDKKVPDTTNTYTNTAIINGVSKDDTVTGPGFEGGKTGSMNNKPVVVAGEEQPAGTTMTWKVEIPGHHLENMDEAVITDVFSDTMTVCEVSGDLKKNLDFKIVARDFLGNNEVQKERDLYTATTVERTTSGINITIPKQEGDFDRETRYFIEYTTCTTSGGVDEKGTEYRNDLTYAGKELHGDASQSSGGGGTGQGVSRGSFSLKKKADQFSEEFPEDTEFTVWVEEFSSQEKLDKNDPAIKYEVKVKADGTPVSGFNNRGNGWIIRLTEINMPTVPGVTFEPGKFLPAEGVTLNADRTVALVAITPKSNVAVELVNKAVLGTAKVTKTVIAEEGTGLTGDEAFVITADIAYGDENSGTEKREFTLKDGQFYDLGKLPIGAKVTFNEVKPMDTDRVTWSEPKIEPKTLTIGADATANVVKVTNEAKVTQGTFALSKKLTGPESNNAAVPDSFEVNATWTEAGVEKTKTLTLPSDGTSVPFGQNLPGGTQVTLTEVVPADGNGLAWGTPAFSGSVTIGDDGNAVVTIGKEPGKVKVTNTVTKNDGTMRITKSVNGEAAEAVADDVKFTVEARWKEGANYRTEILTVKNGEITPLGFDLPYGTEVTFTETDRPEVEGVEWGKITWGTNPGGESWLISNADGTATGIVSDDPDEGRLITLTNEAKWKFGSVEFTKHILGEDGKTTPAKDASLPPGAEFEVKIDNIDPPLPDGTDFPAVGSTITLNSDNGFTWTSKEVLPRNTVVTFSEATPKPLAGIDWARPYYLVTKDITEAEGDDRYGNTVGVIPGDTATVEIHNRIVPTTDVDIDKIVTGPKGDKVMKDPSSTFQITAVWTDVDDEARSCVLDVKPGGSVVPTAKCDAPVIDGKVQFPLNTKINFVETGAKTDVTNVQWGEVVWGVKDGKADLGKLEGEATGTTVEFTGEQNGSVVLGLENKTSSKGLIIIPLPIPLPPFGGDWGSLIPGGPGTGPGPDAPVVNPGPSDPGTGHNGAPGKPAPSKPNQSPSLPVTGANVIWLAGAAIVLIAGGTMLTLRNRRKLASEE